MVKNLPANAGDERDLGLIPGSGRTPGEGHGNPLQYSCLENSMDRRTWQATVHGVTEELGTTEHVYSHSCFYSLFFKTICLYKYVCVCILFK